MQATAMNLAGDVTRDTLQRMLTRGTLPATCPSRVLLDHVTSRWGVLVLVALSEGSLRWGELRRVVEGVSEKMLAQTLRTLEADGLVDRTVAGTVPPRVDYALSATGREITAHLLPLMSWIVEHAEAIVGTPAAPPPVTSELVGVIGRTSSEVSEGEEGEGVRGAGSGWGASAAGRRRRTGRAGDGPPTG